MARKKGIDPTNFKFVFNVYNCLTYSVHAFTIYAIIIIINVTMLSFSGSVSKWPQNQCFVKLKKKKKKKKTQINKQKKINKLRNQRGRSQKKNENALGVRWT